MRVHLNVYPCTYTCTPTYVYTHASTHMCMFAYIHTCACLSTYTHVHVFLHGFCFTTNAFIYDPSPRKKPTARPAALATFAMAVAVLRSVSANHSSDNALTCACACTHAFSGNMYVVGPVAGRKRGLPCHRTNMCSPTNAYIHTCLHAPRRPQTVPLPR